MAAKEPIIQKVGEGRTVQHLPIEIHTSKLLGAATDSLHLIATHTTRALARSVAPSAPL